MRHSNTAKVALIALICTWTNTTYAEEAQEAAPGPPPYEPGAAFKRIEQLTGSWVGTLWSSHNEETMPLKLDYKVISNRSTIVETVVEGDMEMITLYHEKDGALQFKHYCALVTQPELELTDQTETGLTFKHNGQDGLKEGQHNFVDSYELTYDPETPNTLKTYYTVTFADGMMWHRKGQLSRVQ